MNKLILLAALSGLLIAGCSGLSVSVENPEDTVATQVAAAIAATTAALESEPPTAVPTIPPTAAAPTEPPAPARSLYFDPELGYQVSYDPSWAFTASEGTGLSILDGRGRTLAFEKEGYSLEITVLDGVADPGCGGLLGPDFNADDFLIFQIDGTEVWRTKAETGIVNGFFMGDVTFLEVISPEELYPEPDEDGYSGQYVCRFVISDHLTAISYRLPLSLENLEAGQVNLELLAEMDEIMTSLTWNQ